jgi:Flp pilus assembly protein TadG
MTTEYPGDRPIGPSHQTPPGASRGQILIMFALFLVGLLGVLGLAMDLGMAFAQRRTMQNAADASAIAGARVVLRSNTSSPSVALGDVTTFAQANAMNTTPQVQSCLYINDAGGTVGNCSSGVPSGATGVRVAVQETHQTFFIRVVPGAPSTVTVSANAQANVQRFANYPADGPFLVCGRNTRVASGTSSGTMNIISGSSGNWSINQAADEVTFEIHGPQAETCKAKASRYKGAADQVANRNRTVPPEQWFNYDEGTVAGPVSADVPGVGGCKAGQVIDNCVAFLPVVVDNPEETGNSRQLWTVAFLAFYITEPKANEHYGKLLIHYVVSGQSQTGWNPNYVGAVVIRMTG